MKNEFKYIDQLAHVLGPKEYENIYSKHLKSEEAKAYFYRKYLKEQRKQKGILKDQKESEDFLTSKDRILPAVTPKRSVAVVGSVTQKPNTVVIKQTAKRKDKQNVKPKAKIASTKKKVKSKDAWKANSDKVCTTGFFSGGFQRHSSSQKHRNTLVPSMTTEERRRRNGDKSVKEGFSSTGVPLPSRQTLQSYHEKRQEERERHEKFIRENPERKKHGKMIIYIASGGMNKKY